MPSDYEGFPVTTIDPFGVQVSVGPGIDVLVRAEGAGSDSADSPLTTNGDGEIDPGTLSDITAGTVVHFRVEEFEGVSASTSQRTT